MEETIMSKNSRKINYTLRVAKAVERKMFCSVFQKLSVFYPLEEYKYIGFGALYFADFYLIHKRLGIKKMVSIEKSDTKPVKARYNFNKPFNCIDIKFQASNVILPQLSWEEPSIVWLDYTCMLNSDVLSDVATVIRNAKPGSFLIISVNSDSEKLQPSDEDKTKLDVLKEEVGQNKLPRDIKLKDLTNKTLPKVYTKILNKEIESITSERNSGIINNRVKFEQLLNLKYSDGASMFTFGGLILGTPTQETLFNNVGFNQLPFIRTDEETFNIEVPKLTFKEIKFLEALLPNGIDEEGNIIDLNGLLHSNPQIPAKDILKFAKIYQYFPTFAETNLG